MAKAAQRLFFQECETNRAVSTVGKPPVMLEDDFHLLQVYDQPGGGDGLLETTADSPLIETAGKLEEGEGDELNVPLLEAIGNSTRFARPKPTGEGLSFQGTVFNLMNALIGSGLVALPYKMAVLGVMPSVLLHAAIFLLIGLSAAVVLRAGDRTGEVTYTGIVKAELGKGWASFIQWCIILANGGILVVSIIILGDTLVGSHEMGGVIPDVTNVTPNGAWYVSRWFVTLVVTVTCLLPLVSLKSLHSLVHISTSGIVVAVLFALLGIFLAVDASLKGNLVGVNWGFAMDKEDSSLHKTMIHFCSAVSTFVFTYYANPEIPPLMEELKPYSHRRMSLAVHSGLIGTFGIYITLATSLYIAFQSSTNGDILLNLTPHSLEPLLGHALSKLVGSGVLIGYGLKIIMFFPLINWPLRENLSVLIFGTPKPEGWRFAAVTYGILVLAYIISLVVKGITIAIDFVGATAGVGITFLAPAALVFWGEKDKRSSGRMILVIFLVLVGLFVFVGTILEHIG